MATREIVLPELGENIETADVVAVLVEVGQTIREGQSIVEVESEKASVEIPSPFAGVVREIRVKVGDRVRPGQVLAAVETQAEEARGAGAVPGEIRDKERRPQPAAATEPMEPETEGRPEPEAVPPPAPEPAPSREAQVVPAGPAVRRLARELGVDLREVAGTGPAGRISGEDVKEHVRKELAARRGAPAPVPIAAAAAAAPAPDAGHAELPDFSRFGEVVREPLGALRRKAMQSTGLSWAMIPHVTQFDRADITELEEHRRELTPRVEAAGAKLTITAILIKVAALALRAFPKFNASLDAQKEEIVYKKYVHIGVAVDTDRGLVVPVLKDADQKSLTRIAVELADLAGKARGRKLGPDDMRGSNFSVTNLGGLGTTYFTPLVIWPDVAVLGLGRADVEPVFRAGEISPRRILPLSISYDHRLIDGADAARFLRWVAEALEKPLMLFLES
ncbi:MAG: 2-oxo acid dehydrogenase subunit E2 [bacterium]